MGWVRFVAVLSTTVVHSMRAGRVQEVTFSEEVQKTFTSSCNGTMFDGPKHELGAGADGIARAVDLADPPGDTVGGVIKVSKGHNKDKLLLDECKAAKVLAEAGVEHIMQCLAACTQDTCAGGEFCATERPHILTYPLLEEFFEFGMNGKVNFGDDTNEQLAHAAKLVGKVVGQMLAAGYVNSDQGNNIMYRPDGTPLFMDFGKSGWMGKRGGSFPFVRVMVQKIIETFPNLEDWDADEKSPFNAQEMVATALKSQLEAKPALKYQEQVVDYLHENFL